MVLTMRKKWGLGFTYGDEIATERTGNGKKNQQGLFLLIMDAHVFIVHELLQFVNVGLR